MAVYRNMLKEARLCMEEQFVADTTATALWYCHVYVCMSHV